MPLGLRLPIAQSVLLSAFLFVFGGFSAQKLMGRVQNEMKQPIIGAVIMDTINDHQVSSSPKGHFEIPISRKSVVKVSALGYVSIYLRYSNIDSNSIINEVIELYRETQEINEVSVNSNRLKKVVDLSSQHILDYIPHIDFNLVLKKKTRNQRFISMEGFDTTYAEYDLEALRGESLFEDCFGNIHLLTTDSTYECLFSSTGLQFISTLSRKEFDKSIRPCIAKYDAYLFYQNFTKRNKEYTLRRIKRKTGIGDIVYQLVDEVGEQMALDQYKNILANYYIITPDFKNVIELGVWEGDLLELANNFRLLQMIAWYKQVLIHQVEIQCFQDQEGITCFNGLSDSIIRISPSGNIYKSLDCSLSVNREMSRIVYDQKQNKYYLSNIIRGRMYIDEFSIESGKRTKLLEIHEFSFPRNIQIFNGWVYFLQLEAGFNKLYRIRIPENEN
jgi:hypothetical protein